MEKWNKIENNLNEEENNNLIEKLIKEKNYIDNLYNEITSTSSLTSSLILKKERNENIKKCLEFYLKIINEINENNLYLNNEINNIWLLCQLNCLFCYLNIKEYQKCYELCCDILQIKPCLLTIHQQLRCYYFKSLACYELNKIYNNNINNSNNSNKYLQYAWDSSIIVQNLLQQAIENNVEITEDEKEEYNLLHHKITAKLQNTKVGLNLLAQEQFHEALQWFNDAILSHSNSEDTKDFDKLSTYFEGLGNAYVGLKNYSKV